MMGAYAQSDFDTLYRDSYNNLLRLAYRSTKDYHESEDLVDEAFVIYLQKSEIVHINNPRAYLVKIMSNLICNYLRLKMHDNVPLRCCRWSSPDLHTAAQASADCRRQPKYRIPRIEPVPPWKAARSG